MPVTLNLEVSRRRARILLVLIAVLTAGVLVGAFLAVTVLAGSGGLLSIVASQLNLGSENVAAVWYSSMLLFSVALAMTACFLVDREAGSGVHADASLADYGWLMCAAVFVVLSLDELGSVHERIFFISAIPRVAGLHGWTSVLAVPIGIVAAGLLWFAAVRVRRQPMAAFLMVLGILLFVSIPVQEHLEVAKYYGADGDRRPTWMFVAEEGSELVGALLFLAGAFVYAVRASGLNDGRTRLVQLELRKRLVYGIIAAAVVGILVTRELLPFVMDMTDNRGVMENWFPSVVAYFLSLLLLNESLNARSSGAQSTFVGLGVFAVANLLLSVDHGSAHLLTERLLGGTDSVRAQVDVMVALGIVASAGLTFATVACTPMRIASATWMVLQLAAFMPGEPPRTLLALAAYAVVLAGYSRWNSGQRGAEIIPRNADAEATRLTASI